jgi:hypothetical protein
MNALDLYEVEVTRGQHAPKLARHLYGRVVEHRDGRAADRAAHKFTDSVAATSRHGDYTLAPVGGILYALFRFTRALRDRGVAVRALALRRARGFVGEGEKGDVRGACRLAREVVVA